MSTPDSQDAGEFDFLIAGGGVAGAVAALHLARAGKRVALWERERVPRDKVCGEFLAPESVFQLREAGLEPAILKAGAQRITTGILHSRRGYRLTVEMRKLHPGAGHGLAVSRKILDQLLLEHAGEAGAQWHQRVRVDAVESGADWHTVHGTDLESGRTLTARSRLFVDATGRRSRFARQELKSTPYFGFKAHWPGPLVPAGQVHLFFFDGGYGGATVIEQGRTCLSVMASPALFSRARRDMPHLLAITLFQNRSARQMLSSLEPENIRWIFTGPLLFGLRDGSAGPWIHIGDAGGMIDPFTGEGMAMALKMAGTLARVAHRYPYAQIREQFCSEVARDLRDCHRNSGRLGRVLSNPWLTDRVLQFARCSRWATQRLIQATRPRPEPVELSPLLSPRP
jgi:flavin-dependent dehydrogenase